MAINDIIVPREGANNVLTEIVLADATTSARGLLSATDKTKLDGIAAGAEVNVNADWNASSGDAQILNKPASFTPSAHAASHAAGQADQILPSDIGAQSIFVTETITSAQTLTAQRARIYEVMNFGAAYTITMPSTNNIAGDIIVFRSVNAISNTVTISNPLGNGITLTATNQQYRYVYSTVGGGSWQQVPVDTHAHGNLTNDGKVGSTAGLPLVTTTAGAVTTLALGTANQVLRVNSGASGVEFADPSASGISAIGASAADILSVSGSDLVADDPNADADRLVFWDDSASALKYLEVSTGLSISGTTLSATASGGSKTYAVFSAEHNQPPNTAFATLDTRNSIAVLDFDDATDESAVFVGIIPEGASLGSGLKIRLHWMATSATSDNCVWDVSLERMTTDLDSDSFDTIASATAAANGTSGILTVTEITLTTIDSVTAGDGFRLKVTRDANNASDTMSGDAELVLCEVRSAA